MLRQSLSDWAYIDLLLSRFKAPSTASLDLFKPRDPVEQERFRAKALKAYNADGGGAAGQKKIWCCISKKFHTFAVAAHIVPYNIGELQARYIFGDSKHNASHLMSPSNCLIMHQDYEKLLDDATFAIVPADDENLKIIVFDHNVPELEGLDGQYLEFRNDFRPAKRYLYFAFVTALLRRQRHEVPGWWKNVIESQAVQIFATPGEYLKTSTLTAMAQRIGHLARNEATDLALRIGHPHAHPTAPSLEDRMASNYVSVSSSRHDDDDDDDDHPFTTKPSKPSKPSGPSGSKFSALSVEGDDEDEDED